MKPHHILLLLLPIIAASCIEDGITTSPADQPAFSTDTLHMGRVFTEEGTPTHSFRVYNRHDKILSISDISFKNGGTGYFRVNVDGQSGTRFSNVEIRPNDSIYVFVEATLPAIGTFTPAEIEDVLQFTTNGVTTQVVLNAVAQDVKRLHGTVINHDTIWSGDTPHQIFDSLVVAPGATLTLEAGSRLYFHDNAEMRIRGTLISLGTAQAPVTMGGDRTGYVATDIPYEIMSRQWEGVTFTPTSRNNSLTHTVIENTWHGVRLDSISGAEPERRAIELVNCRLRNSAGYALEAHHSGISATGCEFAEGGSGVVLLRGGRHYINHCTIANYYLFSFMGGSMVQFRHLNADENDGTQMPYIEAEITNSIIYGSGGELSHGDLEGTAVYLRTCLLGSLGSDDTHFTDILWGENPLWWTDRSNYIFDYQLRETSPALGAASPAAAPQQAPLLPGTDFYGNPHPAPAAIGAMEMRPL